MEDNQEDFKDVLIEVKAHLNRQDAKLDDINQKFDELNGAKKVLFGLTAVIAAVITAVATYIGTHHK